MNLDSCCQRAAFAALSAEWQIINARLPAKFRKWLSQPQFAIDDQMKCWGMWHGRPQWRIVLNRRLLTDHPWYAVVDVLAHEVAHQLAEEIRIREGRGQDEPPHGALFRECCKYTCARPCASDDYPLLNELLDGDAPAGEDACGQSRLVVKIRKLLSLSGSENQAEAEAALLKARELSAKYDIDLDGMADSSGTDSGSFHVITIGKPVRRITLDRSDLGNILGRYFNVCVYWGRDYEPAADQPWPPPQIMHIGGSRKDLRIATHVHDCISRYLDRAIYDLPAALLARVLRSKRARMDFRLGVLKGFSDTLERQNESPLIQRALMLADRTRLDEYIGVYCPGLRSVKRSIRRETDLETYGEGVKMGRNLKIPTAIGTTPGAPSPRQLEQ